jgi:hypothetical protein
MAFERRGRPPRDGFATTPLGLSVVAGETLFSAVRHRLQFDPSGALWCAADAEETLTIGANWTIAPLPGGDYQVRGFYDHDGDFNPAIGIARLPTRGDVVGGAISNLAAVSAGARPEFYAISLGAPHADGGRSIGPAGARVDGINVTLAAALPFERPMFHLRAVLGRKFSNTDAQRVRLPSDYPLTSSDFTDPNEAEQSLLMLELGSNVHPDEQTLAAASPFSLPSEDVQFAMFRRDVDRDGVIDASDHILESPAVPALTPIGMLTKLEDGNDLRVQTKPLVVMDGNTLYVGFAQTALAPVDFVAFSSELVLSLPPAVLCLDPRDPQAEAVFLVARERDGQGKRIIEDPEALQLILSSRVGRSVRIVYGCLPRGRYAIHLVYASGQTWTLPNEAGVCAASEAAAADGATCGSRAKLASQSRVIEIGVPGDPVYCEAHPTPSACLP